MKAGVNTIYCHDIHTYWQCPPQKWVYMKDLKDGAEVTWSDLVAASKTHVTSLWMSPVRLLDAPAGCVLVGVTEVGRTTCTHQASIADREFAAALNTSFRFRFRGILGVSSDKGGYCGWFKFKKNTNRSFQTVVVFAYCKDLRIS
jgi:hypothetical protein